MIYLNDRFSILNAKKNSNLEFHGQQNVLQDYGEIKTFSKTDWGIL